ncbi:hypothetical protein GWI33_004439 [Rhynchophorus ferrugineus]|uniref:Uncharacterized protein n=1 Tax=Rhynchophorus ferrugineus TaxID=354439 RepID=A0A834MKI5_RHYFE|nr:hypothetical protein GWI33_004439 [Rhynchophorus ferrugineus]
MAERGQTKAKASIRLNSDPRERRYARDSKTMTRMTDPDLVFSVCSFNLFMFSFFNFVFGPCHQLNSPLWSFPCWVSAGVVPVDGIGRSVRFLVQF